MKRCEYLFVRPKKRKISFINSVKGEIVNNKIAYSLRVAPILFLIAIHLGG